MRKLYRDNPTFPVVCDKCPEVAYRKTFENMFETHFKCPNGHIRVFKKSKKKQQEWCLPMGDSA